MKKQLEIYKRDGRSPIPLKDATSKVMSANKAKNTNPELLLRKMLWKSGMRGYRLNWKKIPGRPDIVYPKRKLAIFVNGCFWHRCDKCNPNFPKSNIEFWADKFNKNRKRDVLKTRQLLDMGWCVITVWECEIKSDLETIVENISNYFF